MYLLEKRIMALEIALEAMESYPGASENPEQDDAISTITEMLWAARKELLRRRRRKNGQHH